MYKVEEYVRNGVTVQAIKYDENNMDDVREFTKGDLRYDKRHQEYYLDGFRWRMSQEGYVFRCPDGYYRHLGIRMFEILYKKVSATTETNKKINSPIL